MVETRIIQQTAQFIETQFATEGSGHDWFHVDRVRRMALRLGQMEGSDPFITEMAALLHDLDDWKLTGSDDPPLSRAEEWLAKCMIKEESASRILKVIEEVSYKGAGIKTPVGSVEAAVVQDADRLDAIGAIGIARTFAYGGHKNRLIYDPAIAPVMHDDFQTYKNSTAPTVNHFFEKLLLLKDRMNTQTARSIAEQRHRFMETYLEQFFNEWEIKK
ncbi:MAG TPA: HD domain-containing protein [Prolixibacteraceae bacterium]|nr:HD domain-containing protein [Prolixibacteraceae bacterium]